MWRATSVLLLALWATALLVPTASAQTELGLDGHVTDGESQPIRGLTVYLVHPTIGRSSPSFTDADGYFSFHDVPGAPDPYYLEVYWGRTLMYRVSVTIDRFVHRPNIVLG
jgi:hypothetical protein